MIKPIKAIKPSKPIKSINPISCIVIGYLTICYNLSNAHNFPIDKTDNSKCLYIEFNVSELSNLTTLNAIYKHKNTEVFEAFPKRKHRKFLNDQQSTNEVPRFTNYKLESYKKPKRAHRKLLHSFN